MRGDSTPQTVLFAALEDRLLVTNEMSALWGSGIARWFSFGEDPG
jgi:hypothetical protein